MQIQYTYLYLYLYLHTYILNHTYLSTSAPQQQNSAHGHLAGLWLVSRRQFLIHKIKVQILDIGWCRCSPSQNQSIVFLNLVHESYSTGPQLMAWWTDQHTRVKHFPLLVMCIYITCLFRYLHISMTSINLFNITNTEIICLPLSLKINWKTRHTHTNKQSKQRTTHTNLNPSFSNVSTSSTFWMMGSAAEPQDIAGFSHPDHGATHRQPCATCTVGDAWRFFGGQTESFKYHC